MKKLLNLYAIFAAFILAPFTAYLWWQQYQHLTATLIAWLIPILWAYIVPGIGTNVCKVWEIKSRFNIGYFRIQHGFVFGSATSLFAWLVHQQTAQSLFDIFSSALIFSSVLGFWNIIYDIVAINAGILIVYNQPWAENKTAEAIVMDYAPWIFGGFGFCYGISLATYEYIIQHYGFLETLTSICYFIIALLACILLPVAGVIGKSYRKHGHSGTKPMSKNPS